MKTNTKTERKRAAKKHDRDRRNKADRALRRAGKGPGRRGQRRSQLDDIAKVFGPEAAAALMGAGKIQTVNATPPTFGRPSELVVTPKEAAALELDMADGDRVATIRTDPDTRAAIDAHKARLANGTGDKVDAAMAVTRYGSMDCPDCEGAAYLEDGKEGEVPCPSCGATGKIRDLSASTGHVHDVTIGGDEIAVLPALEITLS